MTMWRERGEEESPRGAERQECQEARAMREREEGQASPFIVGQVYREGHTWLLPGNHGVELRQNTKMFERKSKAIGPRKSAVSSISASLCLYYICSFHT